MNVKEDNEEIVEKLKNRRSNYGRKEVIEELFEEEVKRRGEEIGVVCDDK
ncbi:hypothetical protein [Bacillus pumilus]|nr:hypothetical protein [Bacillus pumilus]